MGTWKNNPFDSDEELFFSWWCEELGKHGLLSQATYHPDPWVLIPEVELCRQHTYTCDFKLEGLTNIISCNSVSTFKKNVHKRKDKQCLLLSSDDEVYIDVKGSFQGLHNNSSITFPFNQKLLYHAYGIYANKVIPSELFKQSFTPLKYLFTPSGMPKKLNYKPIMIDEWIKKNC